MTGQRKPPSENGQTLEGKGPSETVDPLPDYDRKESLSSEEPDYDFTSDEFKNIPELVRTVVGFEDDPSTPVLTFRALLLLTIFCILGSILPYNICSIPVFFVILASDPLGRLLARFLPNYRVPLGRFSFSLNPGPCQGQWATFLPTDAALYYGIIMNPAVALFFGWGALLLGFSFAAMGIPDNPEFVFPLSLQQVTLYRSMDAQNTSEKKQARQQMKGFWILLVATFVWQFLPEYLFPFVASLAPLCWFASRNHALNFIGAGRGGMGLLNITLNWSNITSIVVTYPYYIQVIIFVTFVMTCWVLIPIAYFGNLWGSPTYPIMSNQVLQKNRSSYPFNDLIYLDSNGIQHVNETKYEEVGLAYSGAQYTWQMFMWVASYMSTYVWCAFFLGPKIYKIWKARKQAGEYHQDRLSRIIQQYPGLTKWEWSLLTLIPIIILLGITASKQIYMPIWTYFLIYGYMIDAKGSSRHPLGQLAYRIISGNVWYDARIVLEDQKIGHYLHLPPRQVIAIQITANVLALPINYGVMRWVLATKFDYVSGRTKDPLGQWTGQEFQSYNTAGIQYVFIGPKRLFKSDFFKPILWGFLAGALAPVLMWVLHKKFPRLRFDLWNTTIFFASAATFYGNLSTGPFTTFLVGTFTNFYLYRYRHVFWNKWSYISGAALDTGFNANLLFIFIFLGTTGVKILKLLRMNFVFFTNSSTSASSERDKTFQVKNKHSN
ncbi:OPT oligopeptide transporter protein-domain-containing protein [Aspergillus granulosus]|uniref:OPT oligopeptide transporter protein-domain-containing protein n=1 Tax=Aspergillus granulosus TaxID=176169 RepID=A0ABR4GSC9_9EURO